MTSATPEDGIGREPDPPTPADDTGDIPGDTLANRLLLARTHAGYLTVKEAAERCGVNYGSWSNWERGAQPRDLLDTVQKISEGLRINHQWLLFGGPLVAGRGRPTKRIGAVTGPYPMTPISGGQTNVRPSGTRPGGPTHSRSTMSTNRPMSGAGRRAVRVA